MILSLYNLLLNLSYQCKIYVIQHSYYIHIVFFLYKKASTYDKNINIQISYFNIYFKAIMDDKVKKLFEDQKVKIIKIRN